MSMLCEYYCLKTYRL